MKRKLDINKMTRAQLINNLESSDISRQTDKMELYKTMEVITVEDAIKASKQDRYKVPNATIRVKTYVSNRPGTYGYQFMSAVWIKVDGEWHQASGSKTGGCGYDKESSAIGSALRAVGVPNYIDGTGTQEEFIQALGKKLLGRKPFFMICN